MTITRMPLWSQHVPFGKGEEAEEPPYIEVYPANPAANRGAAMLVIPGGGYLLLAETSSAPYATWLADAGLTVFVVYYRLGSHGYDFQAPLADAQRALTLMHRQADRWGFDPARIGVLGTSAGGHLAATLLTHAGFRHLEGLSSDDVDMTVYPAAGVLNYPVISMLDPWAHEQSRTNLMRAQAEDTALQAELSPDLHVTQTTAPCFVWHCLADPLVPVDNSLRFTEALRRHGIAHELHLYDVAEHGPGMTQDLRLNWTGPCLRWLKSHGF